MANELNDAGGSSGTHGQGICMRLGSVMIALAAFFQGCAAQQPPSFNYADFFGAKELPYDSPPQVIYRIDDHRFVTLDRYRDCNLGDTYYNDTQAGIHQKLGRGLVENFRGRVINADPTGMNLVFPTAEPPRSVCNDRGCNVFLFYSSDGGRTFHGLKYMNSFHPTEDSRNYTIIATKDKLFIVEDVSGNQHVRQFPLVPGIDLDRPYPPGLHSDSGWASKKSLLPKGLLRSPSGHDRFVCDASIKPTNPDAPLRR